MNEAPTLRHPWWQIYQGGWSLDTGLFSVRGHSTIFDLGISIESGSLACIRFYLGLITVIIWLKN